MSVYNGKVKFKHNKLHLLFAYAITKVCLLGYIVLTHQFSLWWLLVVTGVMWFILHLELIHAEYRSRSQLQHEELTLELARYFGMVKLIKKYTVDARLYYALTYEVKENTNITLNNISGAKDIQLIFYKNKAG